MASPHQLAPQVGDSANLLLKKLVTATIELSGGGGVFLTEGEADLLYFRLNGSNNPFTATSPTIATVRDGFSLTSAGSVAVAAGGSNKSITLTPTGTGAVLSGSFGSAANPAYSFVGDTDVGMYRPSANVLGLLAVGSSVLIDGDTNGNITATPSGTGVFELGFNTTTIASAFQGGHITGKNAVNAGWVIDVVGATAVFAGRRANGTASVPTALVANDNILNFGARGYNGAGYSGGTRASVVFSALQNWTTVSTATEATYCQVNVTPRNSTTAFTALLIGENGMLKVNPSSQAISSNALGAIGYLISTGAPTITDIQSSAGTVAQAHSNSLGIVTMAATNAVTYTDFSTLYIAGAPARGANVTNGTPWALWVDSGDVRLDGALQLGNAAVAGGVVPTHTLTVRDSTGTVYRIPCLV